MLIEPKIRGFICTTAHPKGCEAHVQEQIELVRTRGKIESGPKRVLVLGASTGYGLSSRIAAAFGCGADTLGVFFERPATAKKSASAGWYNTAAFEQQAAASGLYARSLNGDAFSDEIKKQVIDIIREDWGQVDCVIYSLASPRRTNPRTGVTHKSVLKTINQTYEDKTLNTGTAEVEQVSLEQANEEEIAATVAVMGGEDWQWWMEALAEAGVLAEGVQTVAYSYIGPEMTWPIYRDGTIGQAKEDLQRAQAELDKTLAAFSGKAWVSINKALVTQASSAIPVVPLYISILYDVMKQHGTHEDTMEQMDRLFRHRLYGDAQPQPDAKGRIRLDDWEMDAPVQSEIRRRWQDISTENLAQLADFEEYQRSFLRLFGFGLEGVDYSQEVNPVVEIPSLEHL